MAIIISSSIQNLSRVHRSLLIILLWMILLFAVCSPAIGSVYSVQLPTESFGKLKKPDLPSPLDYGGCGPVAVTNSLTYLETTYPDTYAGKLLATAKTDQNGDNKIDKRDHEIQTAKDLASKMNTTEDGTESWDLILGKMEYIESKIPKKTIYEAMDYFKWPEALERPPWMDSRNQSPTPRWLYEQIKKKKDVEILYRHRLASGGKEEGHYVTLTSFHFDDKNDDWIIDSGETAWIDFIDSEDGVWKKYDITQNNDGDISFNYNDAWGEQRTAWVATAVSEIPEPGSVAVMMLLTITMLYRHK